MHLENRKKDQNVRFDKIKEDEVGEAYAEIKKARRRAERRMKRSHMILTWNEDRFASLPQSLVVWLSGDAQIRGDLERLGERVGAERAGR